MRSTDSSPESDASALQSKSFSELSGILLSEALPLYSNWSSSNPTVTRTSDIPPAFPPPNAWDAVFKPGTFSLPPVNDGGPIKYDQSGYATDITFPGGKTRHIERDPNTHEAKTIVTTDAEGTTKLVNKNGAWFVDIQGMELPFPGKVLAAKDGELDMQTTTDGVWRIEKPDGKVTEEKENADGARVSFDDNHKISRVLHKDGSSYVQVNDNTIVETHPGAKPCTWTNQGGIWSADNGEKPRKNLTLHDDASVTFEDNSGVKHTINGRGMETLEGAGLGKITPDAANRPSEVETADGKRVRKYQYFDDKSNDIKSVTIVDKTNNTTTVYTRDSKDSKDWRNDQGQIWRGEIRVSPDGVHSIRADNQYNNYYDDDNPPANNGRWTSYYPDGRESSDVINADGSRESYDKNNNLVSLRTADGVRADRLTVNGQETIRYYDPRISETVNWTKDGSGNWTSDSPLYRDSRKDLAFNNKGELTFTNETGGKVQQHRDGTTQITEKDGTKIDFDKDGQITKAVKGNLERTYTRDASGIAVVKDRNLTTKEERTIFERRPPGEENRTNIFVAKNGDLSYQNPDGSAVIERSNLLHLELDKDGDITRVVGPKSTRTFQYIGDKDNKQVVSIVDAKQTDKGTKTETWTRVANPDGTLSSEFRSQDDKGKMRPSRYGITPCADGEYEYRMAADKPGEKAHIARVGGDGNDGGFSDSVEEARDNLVDAMSAHLDEAHRQRFAAMLTSFEERATGRVEAETAGGIDHDKAQAEWDQKVTHTYDYLKQMLTDGGANAQYDLKTRAKLVEDAIFSMAWPAKANDQGNWGCCWQISGVYLGVIQDPDKMAKMLSQLSTTGKFTDTRGRTWTPPRRLLTLTGEGSRWTIENCGDGERNPCSEIWTSVAAYLSEDGRRTDRGASGGDMDGSMHAMKLITGDTWRDTYQSNMTSERYKRDLLLKGGVILDAPGHMYLGTLQKTRGQWQIISSLQHGDYGREINGIVTNLRNWIVHRTDSRYRPDTPSAIRIADDRPIGSYNNNRYGYQYSNYYG